MRALNASPTHRESSGDSDIACRHAHNAQANVDALRARALRHKIIRTPNARANLTPLIYINRRKQHPGIRQLAHFFRISLEYICPANAVDNLESNVTWKQLMNRSHIK